MGGCSRYSRSRARHNGNETHTLRTWFLLTTWYGTKKTRPGRCTAHAVQVMFRQAGLASVHSIAKWAHIATYCTRARTVPSHRRTSSDTVLANGLPAMFFCYGTVGPAQLSIWSNLAGGVCIHAVHGAHHQSRVFIFKAEPLHVVGPCYKQQSVCCMDR